ncbi:hypothetical protein HanXRQr2_Chr08g0361001 [Helianthus annuus]|uniref:Uncharacterized protein n=1 Tax=Helianthus annuus TaxID=4232 RepID=A0A251U9D7_HELAN|nr:hypothetical protein HanXRQr2_Chr08g0361001 [Helianthus annuus]KAJ0903370.1 hypothetical protein HanPSC8_Chr08g0348281 [Helianthus annuus]
MCVICYRTCQGSRNYGGSAAQRTYEDGVVVIHEPGRQTKLCRSEFLATFRSEFFSFSFFFKNLKETSKTREDDKLRSDRCDTCFL